MLQPNTNDALFVDIVGNVGIMKSDAIKATSNIHSVKCLTAIVICNTIIVLAINT
jgi:hypothetical protein